MIQRPEGVRLSDSSTYNTVVELHPDYSLESFCIRLVVMTFEMLILRMLE